MRDGPLGNYFSEFRNYQGDPYNLENSDIPPVATFAGAPIKAGLYYNAAKMAWHGGHNLGILGNLKDPFNQKHIVSRFKAKSVSGSTSNTLEFSSPIKRKANKYLSTFRKGNISKYGYKGSGLSKNAYLEHIADYENEKGWYSKFLNTGTKAEFNDYKNNMSLGLRNRYLLKPNLLADMMENLLPETSHISSTSNLAKQYAQNLYKERVKVGKASSPILHPFINNQMKKGYKDSQQKYITTAWDVISGSTNKSSKATRLQRSKDILFGQKGLITEVGMGANKDQIFKLKRWKMFKGNAALQHASRSEAFMTTAIEKGVTKSSLESANKYSTIVGNHINRTRLMRNVGGAYFGVQIAAEIVRGSFKAGMSGLSRLGSTIQNAKRMEFGGDDVLMNSKMSSERQRAIGEIQNAQMNARYLLGNEAQMYHQ